MSKTTLGSGPGFLIAQDQLLRKLLRGDFEGGQQLKESVLAAEFGVSRPSVREALCQAIGWGVVEYVPYCGYRVRNFTLGDILDWHEMREAVEPIAARNLAEQQTPETVAALERLLYEIRDAAEAHDSVRAAESDMKFHLTLVSGSGNARFNSPAFLCSYSVLFKINLKFVRCLNRQVPELVHNIPPKLVAGGTDNQLYFARWKDWHSGIFNAIRDGRCKDAEAEARLHTTEQVGRIKKIIRYFGGPTLSLVGFLRPSSERPAPPEDFMKFFGRLGDNP